MSLRPSILLPGFLLLVLGAYVLASSAHLPPIVAAHFGVDGTANGFMPRGPYRNLMLVLVVGVPLFIAWFPAAMIRRNETNLNIPNRAYWLDPARRERTIGFLCAHARGFAIAVALFLAYVHGQVVEANMREPPVLPMSHVGWALGVFFLFVAGWLALLVARFRKPR